MTEGNSIADWIGAAELAQKFERPIFFGAAVQAPVDDGSFFVVIFNTANDSPIKGGIRATEQDLDKLRSLGVKVEQ